LYFFSSQNFKTIWPTDQLVEAISYFMTIDSQQSVSSSTLDWAHPVVREWFVNKFGAPTEPESVSGSDFHP
jgi:hypothetical protein